MAKGFKTGGRKKGSLNKTTRQLKDMILDALDANGGVKYLALVARENPAAFCTLLGKVMPTQLTGEEGGPVRYEFSWIGERNDDEPVHIEATFKQPAAH